MLGVWVKQIKNIYLRFLSDRINLHFLTIKSIIQIILFNHLVYEILKFNESMPIKDLFKSIKYINKINSLSKQFHYRIYPILK